MTTFEIVCSYIYKPRKMNQNKFNSNASLTYTLAKWQYKNIKRYVRKAQNSPKTVKSVRWISYLASEFTYKQANEKAEDNGG